MEKESNQMENCCGNLLKSENPIMQQMMKHMKEFMTQASKEEVEKEKKSFCLSNMEKFTENICC